MNIKILPAKIEGKVVAPASKSYSHRAIILACMAQGNSKIAKFLSCDDIKYTISALKLLGANISISKNNIFIKGNNGRFSPKRENNIIFAGNSGTTLRFITAISALSDKSVIIDGSRRLRQRPIKQLIYGLGQLGINIICLSKKNNLPIRIKPGKITGGKINISGKESSQFISSLLLISPFAKKEVILKSSNLCSKPYVDITTDMMRKFGAEIKIKNNLFFIPPRQKYKGQRYYVEGDYSSASYFLAAAAVTKSTITVTNLRADSLQGDKFIVELLKKMGCNIRQNRQQITISGKSLKAIKTDMGNYPDIAPTLAVVAACAKGKTIIYNIGNLKFKESNRKKAIGDNLKRMGVQVYSDDNSLQIEGNGLKGTKIETHADHRIAMSFAVAALVADGVTTIKNAQMVSKSYPLFFDDLQKLGAKLIF